jgi:hypothetical protein
LVSPSLSLLLLLTSLLSSALLSSSLIFPSLLLFAMSRSLATEYSAKSQMIHVLMFALVLQIHSLDPSPVLSAPASPRSQGTSPLPPSPRLPLAGVPTEKLIVDRLTGYLADSDKVFVLGVIDSFLSLNGLDSLAFCPLLFSTVLSVPLLF